MISNEFPPIGGAGVQRSLYFAKYLPEFGWVPVVITVKRVLAQSEDATLLSDLRSEIVILRTESFELRRILWVIHRFGLYFKPRLGSARNIETGVQELRISSRFREWGRAIRKWLFVPDDRILWAPFALPAIVAAVRRFEARVIWATLPAYSSGVIGVLASKLTGVPLVLDMRDPWTHDPYLQGPTVLHRWFNRRLESATLRRATNIVVISEAMKRKIHECYPNILAEKVVVITNGFDRIEIRKAKPVSQEGKFVFGYIGAAYAHHREALRSLCQAWTNLSAGNGDFARNAELWIVGRCDPEIHEEVGKWPDVRVRSLGYQSHGVAMTYLVGVSALVLLIKNLRAVDGVITIPGKLFEYIASAKPLLMIGPEGDAAELIRAAAGRVHHESEIAGITASLLAIFSMRFAGRRQQMNDPIASFDRRNLTERLACLLNNVGS